jgi:hypothetical protein
MPQIRPIPGTGTQYEQAYAGPSDNEPFVLPAPFGGSPDGLGAYARPVSSPMYQPAQSGSGVLSGSPLVRSAQRIARHRGAKQMHGGMRGFGDAATPVSAAAPVAATAALVAFVAFDLVLSGVAGYFVGKAVAPSHSVENKYAWWGVAAGLLGGPLGLGIEAVVALNHKGSR